MATNKKIEVSVALFGTTLCVDKLSCHNGYYQDNTDPDIVLSYRLPKYYYPSTYDGYPQKSLRSLENQRDLQECAVFIVEDLNNGDFQSIIRAKKNAPNILVFASHGVDLTSLKSQYPKIHVFNDEPKNLPSRIISEYLRLYPETPQPNRFRDTAIKEIDDLITNLRQEKKSILSLNAERKGAKIVSLIKIQEDIKKSDKPVYQIITETRDSGDHLSLDAGIFSRRTEQLLTRLSRQSRGVEVAPIVETTPLKYSLI